MSGAPDMRSPLSCLCLEDQEDLYEDFMSEVELRAPRFSHILESQGIGKCCGNKVLSRAPALMPHALDEQKQRLSVLYVTQVRTTHLLIRMTYWWIVNPPRTSNCG